MCWLLPRRLLYIPAQKHKQHTLDYFIFIVESQRKYLLNDLKNRKSCLRYQIFIGEQKKCLKSLLSWEGSPVDGIDSFCNTVKWDKPQTETVLKLYKIRPTYPSFLHLSKWRNWCIGERRSVGYNSTNVIAEKLFLFASISAFHFKSVNPWFLFRFPLSNGSKWRFEFNHICFESFPKNLFKGERKHLEIAMFAKVYKTHVICMKYPIRILPA